MWWSKWGQWQNSNNDGDYYCKYNYITGNQIFRILTTSAVLLIANHRTELL